MADSLLDTHTYFHNARGERVFKRDENNTKANSRAFAYDEAGHLIFEGFNNFNARQEYVWLDDLPVGLIEGKKVHQIHADHLGSPRKVIEPTGNTAIWSWDILNRPFGENAPNQDPDGDTIPFIFNLRFPGQYFDVESGLHYNYFRDYEPGTGRYVESDPIGLRGGVSTFGYVVGAPLGISDPNGLAGKVRCRGHRYINDGILPGDFHERYDCYFDPGPPAPPKPTCDKCTSCDAEYDQCMRYVNQAPAAIGVGVGFIGFAVGAAISGPPGWCIGGGAILGGGALGVKASGDVPFAEKRCGVIKDNCRKNNQCESCASQSKL